MSTDEPADKPPSPERKDLTASDTFGQSDDLQRITAVTFALNIVINELALSESVDRTRLLLRITALKKILGDQGMEIGAQWLDYLPKE